MSIFEYGNCICRDTNVYPPNVYVEVMGHGQTCGTVWYDSVPQARAVLAKWFETHDHAPDGRDAGLCANCQCSHSSFDPAYDELQPGLCDAWTAAVAKGEIL